MYRFVLLIGLCLSLFSSASYSANTNAPLDRAVSLKVIQGLFERCQPTNVCAEDLTRFAGLTRITGYITNPEDQDLIIIGTVDPFKPSLYFDDFIIALRNTRLKYAELRGNTYYYTAPSCSIDPDPQVLQRLQTLIAQIGGDTSPDKTEQGIEQWKEICQLPQQVQVWGVPFDSHFAHVMVTADYDMKRLADGSDAIGIPGFVSLMDAMRSHATQDMRAGRPVSLPLSAMNRFWFCPGDNRYREGNGLVTIEQSEIELLTEEGNIDKCGDVTRRGRTNPFAERFARDFTALYDRIAEQRSIYLELENLYRHVALAKILDFRNALSEAHLDLTYLLDRYQVNQQSVPIRLPGRANVQRVEITSGNQRTMLWLPSCGGVDIGIPVSEANFKRDQDHQLSDRRVDILAARPFSSAPFWDLSGTKGPATIETMLSELGYYEVSLDGNIGPKKTQKAWDDFQRDFGLPATVVLATGDPASRRRLEKAIEIQRMVSTENQNRSSGKPLIFAVEAVSEQEGKPRYLVYSGRARPKSIVGDRNLKEVALHIMPITAQIDPSAGFDLGLVGFPETKQEIFKFLVSMDLLIQGGRSDSGIFAWENGQKRWLTRSVPQIERDSSGIYYAVQSIGKVTLEFYARTKEALKELVGRVLEIFLKHPAYMYYSAEKMASEMRQDIESIQRDIQRKHGSEDGDTQVRIRDEAAQILITKLVDWIRVRFAS